VLYCQEQSSNNVTYYDNINKITIMFFLPIEYCIVKKHLIQHIKVCFIFTKQKKNSEMLVILVAIYLDVCLIILYVFLWGKIVM